MKFTRRHAVLASCAAALGARVPAFAQDKYPSKPVRFVVPFAPGGGADAMSRVVAQKLSDKGYTVVVDNKPGGGGSLGAEMALREPADGYTLLVISGSYAGNAVVNKPNFDSMRAIEPIVQFTREPFVLVAGPGTPYKTLADVIADGKKNPDRISYGSSGAGGVAHLATEHFLHEAGIKATHVPYKGTGVALSDLAGGHIDLMMGGSSSFAGLIKAGKMRPLAVSSIKRLKSLPDVPTFFEQGLTKYRADLWHGLVGPRGTPPAIITKLNADVNAVLRLPDVQARLAQDDVAPMGGSPQVFRDTIREDMERWSEVVKQANIKIN